MLVIHLIEIALYLYLGLAALYVLVFSFAGIFSFKTSRSIPEKYPRMAVLIPGYKEDEVIVEAAEDALKQDYPSESFDVVVIADSFKTETIEKLKSLPVRLVEVSFEKSTKSKALNAAMKALGDDFDIALVLDADNLMGKGFLKQVAETIGDKFVAVQGHRTAKNVNTPMAILDAISEEINNHIFRKGHRVLGLSSALIGSGMAFKYNYFKALMLEIDAVGGFDKELELRMLKAGQRIEYLSNAYVLDEKVQKSEVFARQRKRWLSAQFVYFSRFFGSGLQELIQRGNLDFFDKVIQMIQPPRVLLIGMLTILAAITGLISLIDYLWFWDTFIFSFTNWMGLWLATSLALIMAIPRKFYNRQTLKALKELPKSFIIMLFSLLKLKGANKTFIHTSHGIDQSDSNPKP